MYRYGWGVGGGVWRFLTPTLAQMSFLNPHFGASPARRRREIFGNLTPQMIIFQWKIFTVAPYNPKNLQKLHALQKILILARLAKTVLSCRVYSVYSVLNPPHQLTPSCR